MENTSALTVREKVCRGCTHCMKKCPTEAIRIEKGHAQINPDKCINCGLCMQVCPHNAIGVLQTPMDTLYLYKYRIAVVPAAFFSQFEDSITVSMICAALYDIGFTCIYLGELGEDIINLLNLEMYDSHEDLIISNLCPSINDLISKKYPALSSNLSVIKPPCQITAEFARLEALDKGIPFKDLGVFYFTPCPAKISCTTTTTPYNGVINFDTIYNLVNLTISKKKKFYQMEKNIIPNLPYATSRSVQIALSGGECKRKQGRSLAISGIINVIEFLEELEETDLNTFQLDFLELKSCIEGCVGGILTQRNRFMASERLRHWARNLPSSVPEDMKKRIMKHKEKLTSFAIEEKTDPVSLALDENLEKAIHKFEKVRMIVRTLPGIDCGLCGAPTCKALAEDIAQGQASIRQCAVLRMKNKDLPSLSRIWGNTKEPKEVNK